MNNSLKLLLAINSVFVLSANLLGPLYAVYIEGLGGSITMVSGTWSVMLISVTLTNLILIKYGDRVKEHEHFLLSGFILRTVAWLSFVYASNIFHIIFIQIIIGVGEAVGSTGFDAIFAEHLDRARHIRDYATWKTLSSLIAALATMIGGLIVTQYGFNPMFYLMSIVASCCAIITYLLPRKTL